MLGQRGKDSLLKIGDIMAGPARRHVLRWEKAHDHLAATLLELG